MKKFKDICNIFIISILILINITGCSNKEKESIQDTLVSEEKIEISEEINKIFKIIKVNDESLLILGSNNNDDLVYFKVNKDFEEWEKKEVNFIKSQIKDTTQIISADLNSNGKVVIHYLDENNKSEKILLADINDYEVSNLSLENKAKEIYINNKDLVIQFEAEEKLLHYNLEQGNLIREYKDVIMPQIQLSNNRLIIDDSDKELIAIYDIETGEAIKSVEKLSDYNNCIIFTNNNSDDIYFKSDEGIYKYEHDNNEVELLFNIDNTQLNNTDIKLNKFLVLDDSNILAYGVNSEHEDKLYKYTFGESKLRINVENNKEEFIVYSLYENETIRNYLLNFKYSYPEIDFKYTYGISENNEINENDAILALNTELLSGKGPDILFLDHLNTDIYIEKKILESLNDIVEKNEESLFDNIINEYEKDGKIYSIPTAFSIPIIIGQDVSDIKDLNSLILKCEENINNEEIILNISSAEEIIDTFYDSISTNILKDDKSLNIEAIKDSLNKLKEIYDLTASNLSDYEEEIIQDNRQYIDNFLALYLVHKNANINICNINSYKDILFLSGVQKQYNCEYSLWNSNNENCFKPKDIISVNSNSKNKDIAKEFINSILKGSFYNTELSNLSVNKEVFKSVLYEIKDYDSGVVIMDENGEGDLLEAIKLTENDIENITNYTSSLNKVINSNSIILDKVKNEFISYIEGDINIEEAINKINDNLEIYLSE